MLVVRNLCFRSVLVWVSCEIDFFLEWTWRFVNLCVEFCVKIDIEKIHIMFLMKNKALSQSTITMQHFEQILKLTGRLSLHDSFLESSTSTTYQITRVESYLLEWMNLSLFCQRYMVNFDENCWGISAEMISERLVANLVWPPSSQMYCTHHPTGNTVVSANFMFIPCSLWFHHEITFFRCLFTTKKARILLQQEGWSNIR